MEFLSLKDHVYNYIAKEIQTGKLKSDEKVNEQDICAQLNISRTPVREALIQLAADGFLESAPRRGFRVKPLTRKEGYDIYQILSHLDSLAASLAMDNLTQADYDKMTELIDLMDFHIERSQFDAYFPLQEKFHDVYLTRSHNESLVDTISRLQRRFIRQSHTMDQDEKLKQLLLDTNAQHRKILELFRDHKKEELINYLHDIHWEYHYTELGRTGSLDHQD
ncbi:MAG: GntR family transcriptional regulator [Tissierellia bacterium]|nr:GntR family transcriptional regulator [Tissierellia bacterium]